MIQKKCEHCGNDMLVRQADINRGWGKFCSKSCKAKKQEKRTGQYSRYLNRQFSTSRVDDFIDDFDGSWDAHNS
jgi:DNA-directed RNA polymerase subunit M/transcription elongation factor TFIIS